MSVEPTCEGVVVWRLDLYCGVFSCGFFFCGVEGENGELRNLESGAAAGQHDSYPSLCALEGVGAFGGRVGPAFEVGEGLEEHYLEVFGGAERLDGFRGGAEVVEVFGADMSVEVGGCESDEVGEAEFDAGEAGGGDGGEFEGEGVRGFVADGDAGEGDGDGGEGGRCKRHSYL